jgi:CIC family chloride channel protein
MRARFQRFPKKTVWFQPVAGGLVVGVMGWFVPQILGVGYGHVGEALNGSMALKLMVILLVLKFFAVTTSYASGNAGGIFGPSLFIGAMLGGIIGNVAHGLFPAHVATAGVYALVGMGTAFAGIVRAPMTSVMMIFEITRDYAVIVPLMISNLVSFFISSRLQRKPIYEELARQDGIHLPSAESRHQAVQRQVILAMRPVTEVFDARMTAGQALEKAHSSKFRAWPVTDERGVVGVVSLNQLKQVFAEAGAHKPLSGLVDSDNFPHLHADQSIPLALERMGAAQVDMLPVVSRADVHKLEGILVLQDVLALYDIDPQGPA